MISRSTSFLVFGLLGMSLLAACNGPTLDHIEGHYAGTLIRKSGLGYKQVQIGANLRKVQNSQYQLDLLAQDQTVQTTLNISFSGRDHGSATVQWPGILDNTRVTGGEGDGTCLQSATGSPQVRLCRIHDGMALDLKDDQGALLQSLALFRLDSVGPIQIEQPRAFTENDVLQAAVQQSFESRAEFNRTAQARNLAQTAYLDLAPRLNLSSVLTATKPLDLASLLGGLSNLMPFLFPNRWEQVRQTVWLAKAQDDALAIMRLDIALQAQGLAIAVVNDQAVISYYEAAIQQTEAATIQVEVAESLGFFPIGTTDSLGTTISMMKQELSSYGLVLQQARSALGLTLGYNNPSVVTQVTLIGSQDPTQNALMDPSYDATALAGAALDRSFEIQQSDRLIQAAHSARDAIEFSWLDPAVGIGFSDPSQIQSGSLKIAEIQIKEEQIKSQILHHVADAAASYRVYASVLALAQEDLQLQDRRTARVQIQLSLGRNVNLLELVSSFQDHLKAELSIQSALTGERIALAQLDRMGLTGQYANLLFQRDSIPSQIR